MNQTENIYQLINVGQYFQGNTNDSQFINNSYKMIRIRDVKFSTVGKYESYVV